MPAAHSWGEGEANEEGERESTTKGSFFISQSALVMYEGEIVNVRLKDSLLPPPEERVPPSHAPRNARVLRLRQRTFNLRNLAPRRYSRRTT